MLQNESPFQRILEQFNKEFNMSFTEEELSGFEMTWPTPNSLYQGVMEVTLENLRFIPSSEIIFRLKQTTLSIKIDKPSYL